tara:strand:+ start:758 stop:1144 length:387 start_codon:yes stop_codon:yes gene_type:complete
MDTDTSNEALNRYKAIMLPKDEKKNTSQEIFWEYRSTQVKIANLKRTQAKLIPLMKDILETRGSTISFKYRRSVHSATLIPAISKTHLLNKEIVLPLIPEALRKKATKTTHQNSSVRINLLTTKGRKR